MLASTVAAKRSRARRLSMAASGHAGTAAIRHHTGYLATNPPPTATAGQPYPGPPPYARSATPRRGNAVYPVTGVHQGVTGCLTATARRSPTPFISHDRRHHAGEPHANRRLDQSRSSHDHERQHLRLQDRRRQHSARTERRRPRGGSRRRRRAARRLRRHVGGVGDCGRRLAPDGLDKVARIPRGLQRLSHHDPDIRHRPDRQRQACEPHPDHGAMRAATTAGNNALPRRPAQCHTTAGNYALYSVWRYRRQGVTAC